MSTRRSALTLVAAALLLTGCGADKTPTATDPASAPSAPATSSTSSATTAPSTSAPASTAPSATATTSPTDCAVTARTIPDGEWTGPITMKVRGNSGKAGYTDSKGTGHLTVTVADGKVVTGDWTVTWKSVGHADNGQAAATVNLTGTIAGPVQGVASKPLLEGAWHITGKVTITKPVHSVQPMDERGEDSESMAISSATCTRVNGSFVPSFNSKEAEVTFTGKAHWAGVRKD